MNSPPFDGKPCPMCPAEIRGAAALLHNCLVRWPASEAMVKLNDLRRCGNPNPSVSDNPAVIEMLSVATLLRDAVHDMTDDGQTIRWTPLSIERVSELIPRAEAAMCSLEPLSDEHFRDSRHSRGEENLLRSSKGSSAIRFLPHHDWDYTVDVVSDGADLTHEVCGTGLRLHPHFKGQLARDPTFYGKVWCPACMKNAPFSQFTQQRAAKSV